MRKTVRRNTGSTSNSDTRPADALLGKLMRERRRFVGFSRKGLAAALGMSKKDVGRYEAGRLYFGLDMVTLLRLALKVRIGFFADPVTPIARKVGVMRDGQ
jgi:transcriptional regulator with XRE-family HTH domain